MDATRAHEVGLVNQVVPLTELQRTVQHIGETIAANAPLSVEASKAMIYAAADQGVTELAETAERLWEPVYLSADAQEGPRAFRERRPPRWQGR